MRAVIYRLRQHLRLALVFLSVSYALLVTVDAETARTVGIGYIVVLLTGWFLIRLGEPDGT